MKRWNIMNHSLIKESSICYDCVYAIKEDKRRIGKLVEMWEEKNGSKGIKLHWFFFAHDQAIVDCKKLLKNQVVLENEIFLASGDGVDVATDITLEGLRQKCNVVCISKDERNPQPSEVEVIEAEFVFYRTFDIKKLTFSEIMDDKVSGLEVEFVFNRNRGEQVEDEAGTCVAIASDCAIVSKTTDLKKKMPSKLRSGDNVNKQKLPEERKVRRLILSPDEDDEEDAAVFSSYSKEKIESKSGFMDTKRGIVQETDEKKTKQSEGKLLKVSREVSVGKEKKLGRGNFESPPKQDDVVSKRSRLRKLIINPEAHEFENATAIITSSKERIKFKAAFTQKTDEKKRTQSDYKLLKASQEKSVGKDKKIGRGNFEAPQTQEDVVAKKSRLRKLIINPEDYEFENATAILTSSKEKIKFKAAFTQKSDEKKRTQSDDKLLKVSYKGSAKAERKVEGVSFEVSRKPEDERRKWFRTLPWDERMKKAYEVGTLVLLSNLDPQCSSGEVEDIIWHACNEMCSAKVVQRTAISSPQYGQAFIILKSKEAAESIIKNMEEGCLMVNNERPLFGSLPRLPNSSRKQSEFFGHLSLDKTKRQMSREQNEAVSTSHCSQPNTIEFEMSMEWKLLQARSDSWWEKLYKKQGEELDLLKVNLKKK